MNEQTAFFKTLSWQDFTRQKSVLFDLTKVLKRKSIENATIKFSKWGFHPHQKQLHYIKILLNGHNVL